jgi:lipopolysaccharide export system permease protein
MAPLLRLLGLSRVERYLMGPLLLNIVLGLVLFTFVWMAPEAFLKVLQAIQAGSVPFSKGILILALQIPDIMVQALPMATLMGTVFFVRRLNQDLEWVSLLALGIPKPRIIRPFLSIGLACMGLMILIQNVLLPLTHQPLKQLQYRYKLKNKTPVSALVALETKTAKTPPLLLIGDVVSDTKAKDLLWLEFCFQEKSSISRLCRWSKADALIVTGQTQATLINTLHLEMDETGRVSERQRYPRYDLPPLPDFQRLLKIMTQDTKGHTVATLLKSRAVLQRYRQWQMLGQVENTLWDRLTTPLTIPILVLLGIPIALEEPRKRSLKPLTLATLVLFVYLVAKPLATQIASTGMLHGSITALIPLALLGLLYLVILRIQRV